MSLEVSLSRLFFNYYEPVATMYGLKPQYGFNVTPENISSWPNLPYNAVAYPMALTEGKPIYINVEFKGEPNSSALVRTVDPRSQSGFSIEKVIRQQGLRALNIKKKDLELRMLGDVAPTKVDFNEKGFGYEKAYAREGVPELGVFQLELKDCDLWSRGVQSAWQVWQWQYSTDNGETWQNMKGLLRDAISIHRVYSIIDTPNWPWNHQSETTVDGEDVFFISRPPYIGALDFATLWGKGETTLEGVAAKITARLNRSKLFRYNLPNGPSNYTSVTGFFDCGRFVDRLKGNFGRGPLVNCVDCSHMVISLANVLGCNLKPGKVRNKDKTPFNLNKLTLIGYKAESEVTTFNFHQIAYAEGKDGEGARVFDSCIRYEKSVLRDITDSAPVTQMMPTINLATAHLHPAGIQLGADIWSFGYLAILAKRQKDAEQDVKMHVGKELDYGINAFQFVL